MQAEETRDTGHTQHQPASVVRLVSFRNTPRCSAASPCGTTRSPRRASAGPAACPCAGGGTCAFTQFSRMSNLSMRMSQETVTASRLRGV